MPNIEYNRHSKEAEGILGRIPSWTVRYGAMAVFMIMMMVVIGCCFIKYPDKISSILTIENSPADAGQPVSGSVDKDIVGVIGISQSDIQRVCIGQQVVVRMKAYPYMEYGVLKGEISYVSPLPERSAGRQSEGQYVVKVTFPGGMVTSYNKELHCGPGMVGDAEIIVENRALILKFFEPIKDLFE
ncbi:MAG: hypothetical protein Q4C26_03865 [Bacteroidales bacterium]|nr:hypothetical protein [Bacteroidales bacterium]